ncbi:hypothetical protein F2Q70_00008025 [Brassica cretica]|uniref:Uncharacterized protein n=1 Tax=Brassica cretica TaxID=69181 RepID=A0A8S9LWK8_BRACR|nr:hypothetical protein F2Q68_00001056 [Brassica cretica]KAF2609978.1 hypothetical protein F2Q70_00008025 [Brassica cretica]
MFEVLRQDVPSAGTDCVPFATRNQDMPIEYGENVMMMTKKEAAIEYLKSEVESLRLLAK